MSDIMSENPNEKSNYDLILSGDVERQHYKRTMEIWANDCIASLTIVLDDSYEIKPDLKDFAHAINGYNLELNVKDLCIKQLEKENTELKAENERLKDTAAEYKESESKKHGECIVQAKQIASQQETIDKLSYALSVAERVENGD